MRRLLAMGLAFAVVATVPACGGSGENDASLANEELIDPDQEIFSDNAVNAEDASNGVEHQHDMAETPRHGADGR